MLGLNLSARGRHVSVMRRLALVGTLLTTVLPLGWRSSASPTPSKLKAGSRKCNPIDGATMVYVPPGTFIMGRADGAAAGVIAHRVTLAKGFWIYRTEV